MTKITFQACAVAAALALPSVAVQAQENTFKVGAIRYGRGLVRIQFIEIDRIVAGRKKRVGNAHPVPVFEVDV